MPITSTCFRKLYPYIRSRSRRRYLGAVSKGKANDLLRSPLRSRMSGDVEMDDASAVMSKHDKDEQDFEPDRVYREEVYRSQLGHVIVEERSPRLGWRFSMPNHVFGYSRS
jgi:hypothetical protein